jgi:methionine--tRNA ligase beta chain
MMNNKEMKEITIDQFAELDIRIGTIREVHLVEGADKLLRFIVDLGETITNEEGNTEPAYRQILSGIREYYSDESILLGKQVPVLCNLPVRKLRGFESQGMILYTVGEGKNFQTLCPSMQVENGTQVG